MASGLLPKSPVSSSLCDEVPHIFIPKSHLEPREFLISSAKRLLQQYRSLADKPSQPKNLPLSALVMNGRKLPQFETLIVLARSRSGRRARSAYRARSG